MTIADMVKHRVIQRYGGAAVYTPATVREWLSAVAPIEVKNKRGGRERKWAATTPQGFRRATPNAMENGGGVSRNFHPPTQFLCWEPVPTVLPAQFRAEEN